MGVMIKMDMIKARNWRIFDKAREMLKDFIDELDGNVYSGEEIELAMEDLVKGVTQLNKFYKEKLK
jgi:hypothetical protein